MDVIRRKQRDISVENPKREPSSHKYFDQIDDGTMSDVGSRFVKQTLDDKRKSNHSHLSEGMSLDEEEKSHYGPGEGQDAEDEDYQEGSKSSKTFNIERLLRNFNPDDFLVPPTIQEMIYLSLLRFRARLPMYTTILLIYGIGITYLFTYLIPLLSPDYNEKFVFLDEDSNRSWGIYSKSPNVYHWLFLAVPYLTLMSLITISFYRASNTSPGTISYSEEWDLKMSTGAIQSLELCDKDRQSLLDGLDSNLAAEDHLTKISKQRYFELREGGIVDVRLKSFSNLSEKAPEKKLSSDELLGKASSPLTYSKQMLCGIEENLQEKFKRKYQDLMKNKTEPSKILDKPVMHSINQNKGLIEESKEDALPAYDNSIESSVQAPIPAIQREFNGLFPIFEHTFENKKDGTPRICIRCLKRKCDRCHHCSICNTCILMMDHHCPWINNCIGFYNYKFFFLLINYCMASSYLVNLTYWETFVTVMSQDDASVFCLAWVGIIFLLSLIMGFILTLFCIFHLRLSMANYTTLEYCEKKRENESTWQVSPYDRGSVLNNLKVKLGYDNLFMLPFKPKMKTNGTTFTVTHRIDDDNEFEDEDLMQGESTSKAVHDSQVPLKRKVR